MGCHVPPEWMRQTPPDGGARVPTARDPSPGASGVPRRHDSPGCFLSHQNASETSRCEEGQRRFRGQALYEAATMKSSVLRLVSCTFCRGARSLDSGTVAASGEG